MPGVWRARAAQNGAAEARQEIALQGGEGWGEGCWSGAAARRWRRRGEQVRDRGDEGWDGNGCWDPRQ
jgi:hypothetical protein